MCLLIVHFAAHLAHNISVVGLVLTPVELDKHGETKDLDQWGWTNALSGSISCPIIAGANKCDTWEGTAVGTLTADYENFRWNVVYDVESPRVLTQVHLYIGSELLPKEGGRRGNFTVVPSQFPVTMGEDDVLEETQITIEYDPDLYDDDAGYLVAHAIVCGADVEEQAATDVPGEKQNKQEETTGEEQDTETNGEKETKKDKKDKDTSTEEYLPSVFYAVGDTPYYSSHDRALTEDMETLPSDAEFVVHVGDLRFAQRGLRTCRRSEFEDAAACLKKSHAPGTFGFFAWVRSMISVLNIRLFVLDVSVFCFLL